MCLWHQTKTVSQNPYKIVQTLLNRHFRGSPRMQGTEPGAKK